MTATRLARRRRCRLFALVPALVALLAACGGDGDEPDGGSGAQFTNPVYRSDFPDPFVLRVGKTYHAYATNSVQDNVQTLRSRDLVHWQPGRDAMPVLASWVLRGRTWAPEVLRVAPRRYVLYYTARSFDVNLQCLGSAVGRRPAGPFVDRSRRPLVCQTAQGGSIDASPFRDTDGTLYLLWKNDGNCCGFDTYIYSQRLSADGSKLLGKPVRLVKQDAAWEGPLVEAPTLWKNAGRYYLFYSANRFNTESYAVGYAACEGPLGPCRDSRDNPILETACGAVGPGHQTLIADDDGETWFVYHAWRPDRVASASPGRVLWTDRVVWEDGRPDVEGPTCEAQAAP